MGVETLNELLEFVVHFQIRADNHRLEAVRPQASKFVLEVMFGELRQVIHARLVEVIQFKRSNGPESQLAGFASDPATSPMCTGL
ncbi:MAG: hypothetical protein FJ398_06210 [Verrucomicrobia bacterium]|nr:hypothetical protein [Verrucomicrobiota bacterium]